MVMSPRINLRGGGILPIVRFVAFCALTMICCTLPANERPTDAHTTEIRFNLGSGPASEMLRQFADQLGPQGRLLYSVNDIDGVITRPVKGSYRPRQALDLMLLQTPLIAVEDSATSALLVKRRAPAKTQNSSGDSDLSPNTKQQPLNMKRTHPLAFLTGWLALALPGASAQSTGTQSVTEQQEDETVVLSPFVVSAEEDEGYSAQYTLAGTRIRTDIKDVGSSITIVTSKFLQDTNSTRVEDLLVYTPNAEVSGQGGNFLGNGDGSSVNEVSYGKTRIRGLVSADNTRDFFISDIPWDSYNTGRIDIQRGANSILFGIGSPAGIINASVNRASFQNIRSIQNRVDAYGSLRFSGDFNQVLIKDQLSIRLSLLDDKTKFRQEPAFRDDRRFYTAMRWDPSFLNKGNTRSSLEVTFEKGEIESNLPRQTPPTDKLTAWFNDPELQDLRPGGIPVRTGIALQTRPGHEYIGTGFQNLTTSTFVQGQQDIAYLTGISGQAAYVGVPNKFHLLGYSQYASRKRFPGYTINAFKDRSLTDSSIFDFRNTLIDGTSKGEFNDFEALNVAFRQSFQDDTFGYELAYDHQKTHSGGHVHLTDSSLYLDITSTIPGGLIGGAPDPANPHYLKPYVVGGGGFNWADRTRETLRATVFANLDFNKVAGKESWLARIFGKNTFSGLATEYRDYLFTAAGDDYYSTDGSFLNTRNTFDGRRINNFNYLAAALSGTSASGANIPGLAAAPVPGSNVAFNLFDFNTHEFFPTTFSTVINSNLPERQRNYRVGNKERSTIRSLAAVWQGYWFDGTVIPMVGIRKDTAFKEQANSAPSSTFRGLTSARIWDESWKLGQESPHEHVTSRTYSLVTHLPKKWQERMPGNMDIQLLYNQSENFDPKPARTDILNNRLPNPRGTTKEYGAAISLPNNKLYLKVVHYETEVENAELGAHGDINGYTFIEATGRHAALSHAGLLGPPGSELAASQSRTIYGYSGGKAVTYRPPGPLAGQPYSGLPGDPLPAGALRPAYAQAELDTAYATQVASVNALLASPPPDGFLEAVGFDREKFLNGQNIYLYGTGGFGIFNHPPSAVITGTTISKGVELEVAGSPIKGLDLSLNVSKTNARRTNMAKSFLDYIDSRRALFAGPAGDVRMWDDGQNDSLLDPYHTKGGDGTVGEWFRRNGVAPIDRFKALENSNVPELKPWAFNAVANYAFNNETLKGLNVGAAYRWQDKNVVGFPLTTNPETGAETSDVENPYYGSSEDAVDLWVGYKLRLRKNLVWRVQLNIRNVLASDDLIAVTVNPDGSPGAYRIAEPRTFALTNTIEF
jgi:outer membrane receptor protein involved in Fe transport